MAGFVDDSSEMFPHGSREEVFNIPIGAVVLMDYDDAQKVTLLAGGAFAVNLFVRATFHMLACVCSFASFRWPITKDTVIIRIGVRTFAIALPGLLYGLQFPTIISTLYIENLLTIFMKFSHYLDINENRQGYPLEEHTPQIWNMMRPRVEAMANEAFQRLGQSIGKSRFNILNKNSCYRRAFRMSSITKFVIDSMVCTGALTRDHLVSFGSEAPHMEQVLGVLYPSVNVFTCLVDSLELLWVVFHSDGLDEVIGTLNGAEIPLHGSRDDIGYSLWTVNADGLVVLLRMLLPAPFGGQERSAMNATNENAIANAMENENPIVNAMENENANANPMENESEIVEVEVKIEENENENTQKNGKGKERKKEGGKASTSKAM